jgi:hypothetical protein
VQNSSLSVDRRVVHTIPGRLDRLGVTLTLHLVQKIGQVSPIYGCVRCGGTGWIPRRSLSRLGLSVMAICGSNRLLRGNQCILLSAPEMEKPMMGPSPRKVPC